jgi:hypothetical protein
MRRGSALTLPLALALGCLPVAEPGGSSARVDGTWSYLATNAGSPAIVNGSLTLTHGTGSAFAGSLDGMEMGDVGGDRRVVGVVAGRMLDSTFVDFDVTVAGSAQRHLGQIRGDSLVGTWVEMSGTGITASGAFRSKRVRTP